MKWRVILIALIPTLCQGQISFFNMPNPDMLPAVGYAYAEYDQYQSLKGEESVNAKVARLSVQALPFLEVGANLWFNADHPQDPNRVVLATKWKIPIYSKNKLTVSMSPGSWTSLYFTENSPMKNIFYDFVGVTINHSEHIYTRFMIGAYSKFRKSEANQYGPIAGLEQRLSKKLVFVTDYFGGSGEGFGLATGFVFYALDEGKNLPIYLAYQFDNDSSKNDLFLFEIGYLLPFWKPR
ncbi:MAG: hypothetical protein SH819_07140 [Cytophagales bacterium]|nr:hypothetical protein [Cytophagales bacterium]